jgi:hypothetical protein
VSESKRNPNQEIEEYRDLMQAPSQFEDGFTIKAVLGVLFVAFVMVPGNMYLSLMIGGSLGAAAEWVTIILFAEITKRSFTSLKRQEVYLLFYVASSLISAQTGAFEGLLYNQYLVQSPAAKQFGITKLIPTWVAPPADSEAIIQRTFLHKDWAMPIFLLIAGMVISRISWFTMSYALFRLNSDYERLPFPFAPVNAQGATALAETTQGVETWRWRVFSAGAMIGLVFGAIYVALPAITGALLTEPIQLIPIPFIDFTQVTGNFIPATPLGFTAHLGPIFGGLVVPFWGVIGTFIGVLVAAIANPILYTYAPPWRDEPYLTLWRQGMGTIDTFFVNSVDFWMSFGIGTTVAIALIGMYQVMQGVRSARDRKAEGAVVTSRPQGRGDFPIWVALGLYCLATAGLIAIAAWLLPGFERFIWFFLFFGFVFTPFQSFVNARLVGLVGQTVSIPFVQEATIILSGYRGVDIWFIPFPIGNYGAQTQKFREIELTGTKFTSIIRAELFMVPIILFTNFLYGSYIWKLAPIPSASYPYAQLIWRLSAYQQCLFITGTMRSELGVAPDRQTASWVPANLSEDEWWYWRVRLVDREWLDSKGKRGKAGPWTPTQAFYTHFEEGEPQMASERRLRQGELEEGLASGLPALRPMEPVLDEVVRRPRPTLSTEAEGPVEEGWAFYFEVDADPLFTSSWIQRSTDEPWLFRALKPEVMAMGTAFGLVSFITLSVLGLPILLIFGFVRSLTTLPHWVITEVIGALLARYYFWKKYGKQQWRQYAPILAVGFACGMALMGMASVGIALIQKSVSVLIF